MLRALVLACCAGTSVAAAPQPYVRQATTCDGYPRVSIGMADGFCAGLVVAPREGAFRKRLIKTPRMLLELKGAGSWLATDLGQWTAGRGKVWALETTQPGEVRLTVLVSDLTLPHTIAYGPDGGVYVAEMNPFQHSGIRSLEFT